MKSFEEFGKQLLNIGVAIIVFAVIQPFINHSYNFNDIVIAIFAYVIITLTGIFLIEFGGGKDDANWILFMAFYFVNYINIFYNRNYIIH